MLLGVWGTPGQLGKIQGVGQWGACPTNQGALMQFAEEREVCINDSKYCRYVRCRGTKEKFAHISEGVEV